MCLGRVSLVSRLCLRNRLQQPSIGCASCHQGSPSAGHSHQAGASSGSDTWTTPSPIHPIQQSPVHSGAACLLFLALAPSTCRYQRTAPSLITPFPGCVMSGAHHWKLPADAAVLPAQPAIWCPCAPGAPGAGRRAWHTVQPGSKQCSAGGASTQHGTINLCLTIPFEMEQQGCTCACTPGTIVSDTQVKGSPLGFSCLVCVVQSWLALSGGGGVMGTCRDGTGRQCASPVHVEGACTAPCWQ